MILHVDMDAFYASVEERDRPELAGKPVVVGGTPEGRGVVMAANYVVRKFGVHSAMPAITARRLCPHAIFLPCRMGHYAQISGQIRSIFERYTPLVEPLSLDEAFLDVTGSEGLFGSSVEIGRHIKQDIRDTLQLTASVGVAPNKFLAKIASDLEKPDGFVVVDAKRVQDFLDPLPVGRLWGVGRVTGQIFERLGIQTIGQVRLEPLEILQQHFGQHGQHLWQLAHGQDDRRVVPDREAKSISHETTFAQDIEDLETLRAWLLPLTEQLAWRLRKQGLRGRTVHLKVRYHNFETITRAQTLPRPTDVTQEIWDTAAELLTHRLPQRRLKIRLLGIGVSGLDQGGQAQQSLFGDEARQAQSRLDVTTDQIKARFGEGSLRRGSGLRHDRILNSSLIGNPSRALIVNVRQTMRHSANPPAITYTKGDATAPQGTGPKIIAHVCNDVGGWGAGFVLAISRRWKQPEAEYRKWYAGRASNDFDLGAVQFVQAEPGLIVANMVAQTGLRTKKGAPPIRYDALAACLGHVATQAVQIGASVHMPRIGCGLAGGEWTEVEPLILEQVSGRGVAVTVYDFAPSDKESR